MAEEAPQPHALLAAPDARRLVDSVLAVVERAAGAQLTAAQLGLAAPLSRPCVHGAA